MTVQNTMPFALKAGTKLHKDYEIRRVIGVGGTGVTYLAAREGYGIPLAIKECFPGDYCTRGEWQELVINQKHEKLVQETLQRFEQEAVLMQNNSDNPGIPRVYEIFKENNTIYYVMEYLDGCTLKTYLDGQGGRLDWETTKKMLFPVFNALISLHRFNIWHRDISPDNIFVCRDGGMRIIDFGNAREGIRGMSTVIDWVKEGYAPCEQYDETLKQGTWTDVYALAAVMYRCVTGKVPVNAVSRLKKDTLKMPWELDVEMTPQEQEVFRNALGVLPDKRYRTVAEFQDELYKRSPVTMPLTEQKIESAENIQLPPKKTQVIYLLGLEGCYNGRRLRIDGELIMGRDGQRCNVLFPLDTPGVSGLHCSIRWSGEQDGCLLTDLGSTYGTRLLSGVAIPQKQQILISEGEGFIIGDNNIFAVLKEFEEI